MNIGLITEYPIWFVILCILLGVAYAAILYFRNARDELPSALSRGLAVVRAVTITVLAFLLLSPLLRTTHHHVEKPVIVIGQDNTVSVTERDTVAAGPYQQELEAFVRDLGDDYDVRFYTVGEETRPATLDSLPLTFHEKSTDLSSFFELASLRYAHTNAGALVLASDGIYNRGMNPVYSTDNLTKPVFTIALGDTARQKDLLIRRANYNRMAFLDNDFPVEVVLQAFDCEGQEAVVTVSHQGRNVFRESLNIPSSRYSGTVRMLLPAEEPGLQPYTIRTTILENEINKKNNTRQIYVDVLDSRQKILILANSPHPDVTAIKQAMQRNYQFETEDLLLDDFSGSLDDYDLVVFHQIPSRNRRSVAMLEEAGNSRVPVLFVVGEQTDLNLLNTFPSGLTIEMAGGQTNDAQPVFNGNFTAFRLQPHTLDVLPFFPPLSVPFGKYRMVPPVSVLFYQRVSGLQTEDPLLLFSALEGEKTGVLCGTGLWKWRMRSYSRTGDHDAFDDIINRMVQYLALRVDKRRFRVEVEQQVPENENIMFYAELYDEGYEPVPGEDISLVIRDEAGNDYDYTFSASENAYVLDAGKLESGKYSYTAKASLGTEVFEEKGAFSVTAVEVETLVTRADHQLLYRLARQNDGIMVYPGNLKAISEAMDQREDIKPVLYSEKRYKAFIDLPWLFAVLLILLSVEWFARKRGGSY